MKLFSCPNTSGKAFELLTNVEPKLLESGYIKRIFEPRSKYGYYLSKDIQDSNVRVNYFTQTGLKMYTRSQMNIKLQRNPDEAYLVYNSEKCELTLKIIEKKAQYANGSVDTKLYAAPLIREEYMECLNNANIDIKVEYAFCLSSFFKSSKYTPIFKRLEKHDIPVFFGEEQMYYKELFEWIVPTSSYEKYISY